MSTSWPSSRRSSRRCSVLIVPDTSSFADLLVKDLDGADVRVGDLWRDGPVVLVWIRHYG